MRTRPIPRAYRVFYRQIGLDPDVERVPAERAAVQRLLDGGFRSVGLVADACLIALLETAVPVWALDADAVAAPGLGIRTTTDEDAGVGPCARAAWPSPTAAASTRRCSPIPPRRRPPDRAPAGWRSSRWRSTACRISTSRRRCGCVPS